MAVWQFSIQLLPASWASRNPAKMQAMLAEEDWDLSAAWQGSDAADSIFKNLDARLPRAPSRTEDLITWRDEDDDSDVGVFLHEERLDSLRVRFDVRSGKTDFIDRVAKALKNIDLIAVDCLSRETFPFSDSNWKRAIASSEACHFAQDPHGYFETIRRTGPNSKPPRRL